jgi:hypothetical protein
MEPEDVLSYSEDPALALILNQMNFVQTFPYDFLISILILSFHLLLDLPSYYFPPKRSACLCVL